MAIVNIYENRLPIALEHLVWGGYADSNLRGMIGSNLSWYYGDHAYGTRNIVYKSDDYIYVSSGGVPTNDKIYRNYIYHSGRHVGVEIIEYDDSTMNASEVSAEEKEYILDILPESWLPAILEVSAHTIWYRWNLK